MTIPAAKAAADALLPTLPQPFVRRCAELHHQARALATATRSVLFEFERLREVAYVLVEDDSGEDDIPFELNERLGCNAVYDVLLAIADTIEHTTGSSAQGRERLREFMLSDEVEFRVVRRQPKPDAE